MRRGTARLHPAIFALLLVMFFGVLNQAQAGPITNGPGVAPFVKLGVYQGVISVVPGGFSDSVMEIGNAGRDIASTGALYLRPGTIGGQGGNIVIAPQSGPDEGGEIALLGYTPYQTWNIDVWQNRLRVHTNGQERIIFDGTAGNIYIPTGSICYGNVGSTNCLSVAGGPGLTPTLDQVLGSGNASVRSAALGAVVSPSSKLVINNGTTSSGNSSDGISSYANTAASAIYAQQSGTGFAGYFSGKVEIQQPGTGPITWDTGTSLRVAGNISSTTNGAVADIRNTSSFSYALKTSGITRIDAASSSFAGLEGALRVQNTSTGAANQTGTAIYALGGNNFLGPELLGSVGLYARGATGNSSQYSYGILAESASLAATDFNHYAAYFKGRTRIDGNGDPATGDDYLIIGPQGIEFSCPNYTVAGVTAATARFLDGDNGGNGSYSIRTCYRRTTNGTAGATKAWGDALALCTAWGMRLPTLPEAMLLGKRACASNGNSLPTDNAMWTSTLNGGNPYAILSGACSSPNATPQYAPQVGSTLFHVHCVY